MYKEYFPADSGALEGALESAGTVLSEMGISHRENLLITVAIEEALMNIISYAYPEGNGEFSLEIRKDEECGSAVITIVDHGIPFDPLSRRDPDVTAPAEDRDIGGLGIFLLKKTMDDVRYSFENGENILVLRKEIEKR